MVGVIQPQDLSFGLPSTMAAPNWNPRFQGPTIDSYNNSLATPTSAIPTPTASPGYSDPVFGGSDSIFKPAGAGSPLPGSGGGAGKTGGLFTANNFNLAMTGIQAVADIWNAWEQNRQRRQQMADNKKLTNFNLEGQRTAYNLGVEDKFGSRGAYLGQSQQQIADAIDKHQLGKMVV